MKQSKLEKNIRNQGGKILSSSEGFIKVKFPGTDKYSTYKKQSNGSWKYKSGPNRSSHKGRFG